MGTSVIRSGSIVHDSSVHYDQILCLIEGEGEVKATGPALLARTRARRKQRFSMQPGGCSARWIFVT
jgi:hypothetical protein